MTVWKPQIKQQIASKIGANLEAVKSIIKTGVIVTEPVNALLALSSAGLRSLPVDVLTSL